jgi:hypothetical protein
LSLNEVYTMAKPLAVNWKKEQLPAELVELSNRLELLPRSLRESLIPLCDRICHFTRLQSRLVTIAQDAVDQLQLDIKYLLFDLDVTRGERDALRQELEERTEGF